MAIASRIPPGHKQTTYTQTTLSRMPSPYFAPPAPGGMREPGTGYLTIITAKKPVAIQKKGAR